MPSAASGKDTIVELARKPLQRMWVTRLVLSIVLLLVGGGFLYVKAAQGWIFVVIAAVLGANAITKLRGLGGAPRIALLSDQIEVWGLLLRSPQAISYSRITFVEWRMIGKIGVARIATSSPFPTVITSSFLKSLDDFHLLVAELSSRLPRGSVIDRDSVQRFRPLVSLLTIVLLISIHTIISLQNSQIAPIDLIERGAFMPVLFSDGEWFRALTDAGLHVGILHLALNLMLIAFGFGELEEVIGHARIIILMVSGAIAASLSTWAFSSHAVVVGASGMAYSGLGAIAYLLIANPKAAPTTFRVSPAWLLLALIAVDTVLGILVPEVSFAMHSGGFVAGFVVMSVLSSDQKTLSRFKEQVLATSAVAGLLLVAASAYSLFEYHQARHPNHLMQLRLLNQRVPATFRNGAAYRIATNPKASKDELRYALSASKALISLPNTAPRELAAYQDTAATLLFRNREFEKARSIELAAFTNASSLPKDQQVEVPVYLGHLAQFELAAPDSNQTATQTGLLYAGRVCTTRSQPNDAYVRAVTLREHKASGLLLIPSTRHNTFLCVAAPSITAADTVRITHVGASSSLGEPRFFPVLAKFADLPEFILHPMEPTK